ncbi:hypothetical protein INT48_004123 [Thamnidium elegans]|uniref:Uncharacterized protein n=1 Tax=Thamnidium elegans TaxID=101142 RepID=A0A8H7SLP1_9FUNG|nr:hypothetical protein INT48_004123 [Thamnidium elegans]
MSKRAVIILRKTVPAIKETMIKLHFGQIYLYFMDGSSDTRIAKCTTGGALIIHGTKDYYHGECIDATGVSNTFMLPKEDA